MSKDNYFERVEAYCEGKMSDGERQAFRQELAHDTGLQEALERYRTVREAVDVLSEEALREKFARWREAAHQEQKNPESREVTLSRQRRLPRTIPVQLRWAAAVVLLLIVAFPVYHWLSGPASPDYFIALSSPLDGEALRSVASANWIEGLAAYENKDFDTAIQYFQKIDPKDDQVRFFLGHALYLNNEYENAAQLFKEIIDRNESIWVEEAQWGLLGCWYQLKTNKPEFDSLVNRIAENEGHSFYRDAVEMLDDVKGEK